LKAARERGLKPIIQGKKAAAFLKKTDCASGAPQKTFAPDSPALSPSLRAGEAGVAIQDRKTSFQDS
jgi:hypothetical protein